MFEIIDKDEVKIEGKVEANLNLTLYSWILLGSNQRPSDYESDALTV